MCCKDIDQNSTVVATVMQLFICNNTWIIPVSLCMLSLVGHSEIFMYGTLSERPRYNCTLQNSKCFWRLCDFGTFLQFFEVCCNRTPSVGHAVLLPCQHSFVAKYLRWKIAWNLRLVRSTSAILVIILHADVNRLLTTSIWTYHFS